ncbi:hypothetical protein DFP72DRAFT_1162339 [Ephemerocybe angulata]|uniref:MYND-type domain-containing protein n=1 Tax=Ephemerocybe angulata TaxID=980116 RepID=A0A8H6IJ34_9AGAR|nr:hypothetical protein DFP72DRAFT_1162339 [Tulosesus angulatus]
MATTTHQPPTRGTWTVRKNFHYLATQSLPTNRAMRKEAEYVPAYWLHVWPERNLEPWRVILDTLRTSIPTCKMLQDSETSAVTVANDTRAALYQAELVLNAFARLRGTKISGAEAFIDSHFNMLLDCWNDVLKWLLYLMLNTPTASDPLAIFTSVRAFAAMICYPGWSHLQEELLDKPQTIDYLYLVLYQKDPDSELYWYIPQAVYRPGCVINESLRRCLNWESTTGLLVSRFKAMRSDTRAKVVQSLCDRPKRMVSGNIRGRRGIATQAGADVATLCLVVYNLGLDPDISKKVRRTMCYNVAHSLSVMVADGAESSGKLGQPSACDNVVTSILILTGYQRIPPTPILVMPHSHHRIRALVRANAVSTVFECFMRLIKKGAHQGDVAEVALRQFLANMSDSEVYRAVLRDLTEKEDKLEEYIREVGSRASIAEQYKRGLGLARLAFEVTPQANVRYNLCANNKHPESSTGEEDIRKLRQCSDCLSVAYCSEQCRTEDWARFHSYECKLLAHTKGSEAGAASYSYVPQSVRRDQLRFLECIINSSSPDVPDEYDDVVRPTHIMVDFRGELGNVDSMDSFAPIQFGPHPQGEVHLHCPGAFQRRVAQYSSDARAEPERYMCAEGIFVYDWQWSTHVFAKLQYSPEAPEETRYRIMESVFVLKPWVECHMSGCTHVTGDGLRHYHGDINRD